LRVAFDLRFDNRGGVSDGSARPEGWEWTVKGRRRREFKMQSSKLKMSWRRDSAADAAWPDGMAPATGRAVTEQKQTEATSVIELSEKWGEKSQRKSLIFHLARTCFQRPAAEVVGGKSVGTEIECSSQVIGFSPVMRIFHRFSPFFTLFMSRNILIFRRLRILAGMNDAKKMF
jgi:hypothetical protein